MTYGGSTYAGSTYAGSAYASGDASEPIEPREGAPVPSQGWHVEITHPTSGRVRVPDVIDLQNAPVYNPGPNAQPVARIPVAKDDVWLSDAYDDGPEMRVWRDGRRLPIEVLRNVEQREGATVLVGVGGVELEGRVTEEYNDDRRHLAVRDLVETETTYGVDAPEPDTATLEDVVQQEADTEAEFLAVSTFGDTSRIDIGGGTVSGRQIAWTRNSPDFDAVSAQLQTGGQYFGSEAEGFSSTSHFAEINISVSHTIPADDVQLWIRFVTPGDDGPEIQATLAGHTWTPIGSGSFGALEWRELSTGQGGGATDYNGGDIPPGDYALELSAATNSAGVHAIDVVAPVDGRNESDLFFDEDTGGTGEEADGPGHYAPQTATFDNAPSAFNVTAGSADITIDNTTGAQRLQISNDNGATWLPDDGSENNTTSVSVTYPSAGSGSRLRVTLDAYEPNGPRDQTPRLNYASQELDAFTLRADITQELLLIAETFDNSLASVLSSIGEPAERSWGLQTDANGDIVVRFVQNGQFVADYTPEFSDRTREKLGKTYQSITVKGSNEPESNVPYTASTSYTALPRNNILTGSETVYDDTRNYDRGDDYEMRYRDGEIRATEGGDLDAGTDYRIDFRYQAQGTFTSPDAPANPDELVETVPGVTSERLAEQVAFVIASEADAPRYAAEVTIPDPDPRFDPTEALPPSALGLPSAADDLEVRGEPQLTEEGLRVRFGTRPSVEQTQQRLSRQLSRVSDRS